MIPAEAVEAAVRVLPDGAGVYVNRDDLRTILEAAAPYMRAQALNEAAEKITDPYFKSTSEWLRALAEVAL